MLRIVLFVFLSAVPAMAEEVVAGLSQTRISISTNFDGSEMLIFGSVGLEEAIPDAPPLRSQVVPSPPVHGVEGPASKGGPASPPTHGQPLRHHRAAGCSMTSTRTIPSSGSKKD